ncbi:MAG: Stress response protein NhaX [Pelotomaculum sp. PtaB.Bin104]|nr:MAG: Stress response protein NhaX [Pelotomaculum sp. PtaB.Bin104]
MYDKILVAFDNGNQSQKALDNAIKLARSLKSKISIVTSFNISDYTLSFGEVAVRKEIEDQTRSHIEEILKSAAEKVAQEGIEVNTEILYGTPGEAIAQYAKDKNVNLIVIGSNNRNAIGRMFLGSVSNYVVHHAQRPVLVIRE